MPTAPIGLVGVGLLGTALAERMLAAGLPVVGYDLSAERLAALEQLGGSKAATLAEVAAKCRTIVLSLPESHVVAAVVSEWAGELASGALLIDSTTGDPDETADLAEKLAACSVGYVDATIAGSSEQVRQGQAAVILGGTPADSARAEPVLQSWSPRRFHVGPAGSGARLKLVVNLVLGLNRAVLAEGLSLAKACGIDPAAALEVLMATPASSAVMQSKGPKMVAGDFAPQARLAQHLKDVRLIRDLAGRVGAATPLSDVHERLLLRVVELGWGDADNSAVIRAFSAPPSGS
jgi:3-hydroxyisobutyrate dehydrogenase-like beta-hydroxyacid dehydrogenase